MQETTIITVRPTDEEIIVAGAAIAHQYEGRDEADFIRRSAGSRATYAHAPRWPDQHGRYHLCMYQDAWRDVSYMWEPNPEIVPTKRCTDDRHFPCLGGRIVVQAYSIGD